MIIFCQICHKQIEPERVKAVGYNVEHCAGCAQFVEKNRAELAKRYGTTASPVYTNAWSYHFNEARVESRPAPKSSNGNGRTYHGLVSLPAVKPNKILMIVVDDDTTSVEHRVEFYRRSTEPCVMVVHDDSDGWSKKVSRKRLKKVLKSVVQPVDDDVAEPNDFGLTYGDSILSVPGCADGDACD